MRQRRRTGVAARRRRLPPPVALFVPAAVLLGLALTDRHLADGPTALVVSTVTGALAVAVLALQPLLVARVPGIAVGGRARVRGWHQALGLVALALVLAHVGALYVLSPEDTRFAVSPDGPTRGRMALLATVALVVVAALGLLRDQLPMARSTWRILHAFFATLVVVLGIGHAVLTDGALDDAGTAVMLVLAGVALGGVATTQVDRWTRSRRRG